MRHKPVFGKRPFGKRDAKLLLIAYFDPNGIETIPEGIASWQSHSRHEFQLLNLWPGRNGQLRLPEKLDLLKFEGIIIHPTVSYFPQTIRGLDIDLRLKFSEYDGVKILMKQDEQVHSGELSHLIADCGFDIVFSCLPEAEQEKVYPRAVIGDDCIIFRTLTGYVSPKMRQGFPKITKDLGVTYRGSIQPLEFGRLGYEKRGIGYDVAKQLLKLPTISWDISSKWEDRLTGSAWDEFLNRSNIVLGVESGSNIFDFDGSITRWCREYSRRHLGEDVSSYEYYITAHNEFLHLAEGNVNYAQISPRHFEAAAAGAAQLLYEGDYSGIFMPGEHFFPLKRNLENLDGVIDFIKDFRAQSFMAGKAFEEIILNEKYWYENFVSEADQVIDKKLFEKGLRTSSAIGDAPSSKPTAFILCAHDPKIDPRIDWFAESLCAEFEVTVIGTYHFNIIGDETSIEMLSNGVRLIRTERTRHEMNWVPTAGELRRSGLSEAHLMLGLLAEYARLPTELLKKKLGGDVAHDSEIDRFRSICEYMVNTNSALLNVIDLVGTPNLVVGVDLEALFSATICGEVLNIPVVFDAHEYWPYSYTDFQHWEIEFWSTLEGRLSQLTDINIAVTPQLAEIMGREYSVQFRVLPNATNLREGKQIDIGRSQEWKGTTGTLNVLYQGGFAAGRGLEELINAWEHVKTQSTLVLRGPQNEYRDRLVVLARSLGLDESRVAFPPAVDEREMIEAASKADIGVIPYNPAWFGYRYCCPNKLSQYAAAGLPILTSGTEFVSNIVHNNDIGFVVDISAPKEVARLIDELADNRQLLLEKGQRARNFFETSFHWDELGREIFKDIALLCRNSERRQPDFEGIDRERLLRRNSARYKFDAKFTQDGDAAVGNVLLFEKGARVVSSSAFFPFPHDPGHVLRRDKSGYSAALENTSLNQWMEFELAELSTIDSVNLTWFDKNNRASGFKVLLREDASTNWIVVVEEEDAKTDVCCYRLNPTRCRFVRIETITYVGQQRMLLRKFELLRANADAPDVSPPDLKRSLNPVGPKQEYKTISPNLLRFEAGAMVVASSAFSDWPNDPGYLLRDRSNDGYAAGILGSGKIGFIEFGLGRCSLINTACIEWYSAENRATRYRILAKKAQDDPWKAVISESSADKTLIRYDFNEIEAKFIRIETSEYIGQLRLLLRRFELFCEHRVKLAITT